MKKSLAAIMCGLLLGFSPCLLAADDATAQHGTDDMITDQDASKGARQKLKSMTPEQRKAFMQDAKKKWDSMSQADKDAFKTKVKARADKMKERLEKRHKEMTDNDGELIFIRIYAIEQLNNNAKK